MTPPKIGILGLFSINVGTSRALDKKIGKSTEKVGPAGQPAR